MKSLFRIVLGCLMAYVWVPQTVFAQPDVDPSRFFFENDWTPLKKGLKNPESVKKLFIQGADSLNLDVLRTFSNLEGLIIRETELANLDFLQYFPQISIIELHGNSLYTLQGIEHLKNLKELSVENNFISDLSPLANHTGLTMLELYNNEIKDLEPLRNLTNLRLLDVSRNKMKSIEPLCGLTQLEGFAVFDCPNLTDISCIEEFVDLRFLNISLLPVSNFSLKTLIAMEEMDNLRIQGMVSSNEELDYIKHMTKMTQLTMGLNPNVTNIDSLKHFEKLEYLDIHGCNVPDLGVTIYFPELVKLVCYNNPIHDINILASHVELRALFIHFLPLSDYSVLNEFVQLQYLSIDEKGIGKETLDELRKKLPNTEFTVY